MILERRLQKALMQPGETIEMNKQAVRDILNELNQTRRENYEARAALVEIRQLVAEVFR